MQSNQTQCCDIFHPDYESCALYGAKVRLKEMLHSTCTMEIIMAMLGFTSFIRSLLILRIRVMIPMYVFNLSCSMCRDKTR